MDEENCERCDILSGELMEKDDKNERLKKILDKMMVSSYRSFEVAQAHNELAMSLFTIQAREYQNSDPEMAASEIEKLLITYFDAIGYTDISLFIRNIKTYY